ncbi:hypothetical protein IAI10_16260 [Clostridium sp. 19966]|uniref:hypothetical protein n=1 Tax=Clostridium sp. 19966 TaxID=2768166 RepID=UPI0028DEBCA8|nr:hypothetical protein [Clostridium sp. 19966]MDT8718221.1 hypothetical protein [Clostridium sp. 19966]
MAKKIFLSLGSEELEDIFRSSEDVEIMESESNLVTVLDLIEYVQIEFLFINTLLDDEEENIARIIKKAEKLGIKSIVLVDNFENKTFISFLVGLGVHSFVEISKVTKEIIRENVNHYPREFDFTLLSSNIKTSTDVKKETVVRTVKHIAEKQKTVEVVNGITAVVISNAPTGKSTLAWIISHLFAEREYNTALVNIDQYHSANILLGTIEDQVPFEEEKTEGISIKNNFTLFTGEFMGEEISKDKFQSSLDDIRLKFDVTIIDCKTGYSENMMAAMINSDVILFVFDMNNVHTRLNISMIEKLKGKINPQKIIVIINNSYRNINEYENTIKFIKSMKIKFRDILSIKASGECIYECMFSTKNPVAVSKDKEFIRDLQTLMKSLNAKESKKGIFKFLTRRFT